jgi:hypothetical protein
MKGRMVLLVGAMVLCLGLLGTPASWANSLTFQNVSFDLSLNGTNLDLRITNALNANGDWAGIDHLSAFAFNQYGTATGLGNGDGWTVHDPTLTDGLGASGCTGSGNFACFDGQSFALTNDFTFAITRTGGAFSVDNPPSLKVLFSGADVPNGHGNLLSQPVPAVPVPGTLLMFGLAFLLFVGWNQWYKRPTGLDGASA